MNGSQVRLLTVVIPAYNVESCIEESLNSVLSQRWIDSIDIAVIDQGSTDSTYAAASAVAERDRGEHIRLLRASNRGFGEGCKVGLSVVKTPYVTFLDGHDIHMPDFSDVIVPLLTDQKWDVIEYDVAMIGDSGQVLERIKLVREARAGGHAVDDAALMDFAQRSHAFAWARTYKTALFQPDPFPAGARHHEEEAVVPSVYARALSVYGLRKGLVGYRRRGGRFAQASSVQDVRALAITGDEILTRCKGGEHDEFWMTVFRNLFRRTCRVAARVEGAPFGAVLSLLDHMATNYRRTRVRLPGPVRPRVVRLGRFRLGVYMNRAAYLATQPVRKAVRRYRHRHGEAGPAMDRYRLPGPDTAAEPNSKTD